MADVDENGVPDIIGLEEALVMTIPMPMDIVDMDGNVLYANEVMKNLVKERGDIRKKKCWELYRDDKTQCTQCPLHKKVDIGNTNIIESSEVLGGRTLQISHTGMIFDGRPAVLEIFNDITEQKKMIETEKLNLRLQVSITQLAKILLSDMPMNDILDKALEHVCNDTVIDFDNSGGIFLLDKKKNELVLTVNHNLSKAVLEGCARIPVGKKFCGGTAQKKEIRFAGCCEDVPERCCQGPSHGHYSVPILYGEELLGVIIFYLEDGHVFSTIEELYLMRVGALLANLIKNKEAEKKINQLSRVVAQSSNSIVVTDIDGNIEYVNSKFTEITGYQSHEVIGKNPRILKSGNTSEAQYRDLWNTILSGATWRGELENKRKDGEIYWQSATISSVKGEDGKLTNFVAITEDITEQKLIQAALADANRELVVKEGETEKILADIKKAHQELKSAQGQLVQSEKLASLGHMSAGVAHEINNPLAFISSNMEILHDYLNKFTELIKVFDLLKESVKEKDIKRAENIIDDINQLESKYNVEFMLEDVVTCLTETQTGLERIKKIVVDLRTFTRKDEGKLEPANIEEIIEGMINIVWNELKYKVELTKEYGNVSPVMCNTQKLGQVFINLLMNASQAMDQKGNIIIKTYQEAESAFIEVSDTGSGIPQDKIGQIFDPFFTTKKVGEGTGLGLSVSYDIIKQHGGEMTVKSEVGKGTTFKIELPISQGEKNGQEN